MNQHDDDLATYSRSMANDIHTIMNILLFFFWVTVLAVALGATFAFQAARSADDSGGDPLNGEIDIEEIIDQIEADNP